jgi:hypothetical protein
VQVAFFGGKSVIIILLIFSSQMGQCEHFTVHCTEFLISVLTYVIGMDEDEEEVVPLPNVNSAILKKVIQWATYHKDDPPPPEDDENKEKRTDDISSWDADFLKVDQGTLFELILVCLLRDVNMIMKL